MKILNKIPVITIALTLLMTGVNSWAQKTYQLFSPNGKLNATVSVGDGLAYRFTTSRKDELTITAKEMTLHFTKDFMTFAPYSGGEGTFEQQFHNSFESPYVHAPLSGLDVKRLIFMPVLVALDEDKKLCITEADLYGFPGAWLNGAGETSLQVVHANYPKKSEPRGSSYFVLEREEFINKRQYKTLYII